MLSKRLQVLLCSLLAAALLCSAVLARLGGKADFITPDTTTLDLNSCRHTHPDAVRGEASANELASLDGYALLAENDRLALYLREDICNVRVLNKQTGYVWGSVPADGAQGLNDTWTALAQSLVTFTYLNEECMSSQISAGDPRVERTLEKTADGGVLQINDTRTGISFAVALRLQEDGISVSMVEDSLQEDGDFLLESLYFLPFFGCTYGDRVSGYMFVPDGPGALIRYAAPTKYLSPFDKRVYGIDPAVDSTSNSNDLLASRTNDYLTDAPTVTAPVFGAVHGVGSNAFLAVIDEGATYASIYASPAEYVIDYNWVTARFDFRTVYAQTLKKDGSGIPVNQQKANRMNPSVSYHFLAGEEADYSGMAVKYRSLLKQGLLKDKQEQLDAAMPLRLAMLAADIKSGKFFNHYIRMTSVNEAAEICRTLAGQGVENITLSYIGWTKGGLNGGKYGNTDLDRRLGSLAELEQLRQQLEGTGGQLFLQFNPLTANKDQCNPDMDSAKTIANKNMGFVRDNKTLKYNTAYVMQPKAVVSSIRKLQKQYEGYGLALSGLGGTAYGDFTKGDAVTRDANENALLKLLDKTGGTTAFSMPNAYLWGDTDAYLDMPLENSQYLFETDSVPFLPMVLKGSVDYYSPYINQGYYTEDSLLKMMEYGTYPSFLTMQAENEKLIGTPSSDYFSINMDNWQEAAVSSYRQLNAVLEKTEGAYIEEHRVLQKGVVRVRYSNGMTVYVNYLNEEYRNGAVVVGAKSGICTGEGT